MALLMSLIMSFIVLTQSATAAPEQPVQTSITASTLNPLEGEKVIFSFTNAPRGWMTVDFGDGSTVDVENGQSTWHTFNCGKSQYTVTANGAQVVITMRCGSSPGPGTVHSTITASNLSPVEGEKVIFSFTNAPRGWMTVDFGDGSTVDVENGQSTWHTFNCGKSQYTVTANGAQVVITMRCGATSPAPARPSVVFLPALFRPANVRAECVCIPPQDEIVLPPGSSIIVTGSHFVFSGDVVAGSRKMQLFDGTGESSTIAIVEAGTPITCTWGCGYWLADSFAEAIRIGEERTRQAFCDAGPGGAGVAKVYLLWYNDVFGIYASDTPDHFVFVGTNPNWGLMPARLRQW